MHRWWLRTRLPSFLVSLHDCALMNGCGFPPRETLLWRRFFSTEVTPLPGTPDNRACRLASGLFTGCLCNRAWMNACGVSPRETLLLWRRVFPPGVTPLPGTLENQTCCLAPGKHGRGFVYYQDVRELVEVNDCTYYERSLLELQCSLA